MHRLWEQLKVRGVLRLAAAYLAIGWLTFEITSNLFQLFDLPKSVLRAVFIAIVLGLPVATIVGWYGRYGAKAAPTDEPSRRKASQFAVVFAGVIVLTALTAAGLHFFGDGTVADGSSSPQAAVPAALPPFAPPTNSIAVLSFVNTSGDATDDYFSDGLSEELLNTLVRIRGLQVVARTSAFSFKGVTIDVPTVARKLNVAAVLEGSVRRAGGRVRITAQLVNALSGFSVWSQSYEGDLKDVFALQAEIATSVARALRVELLGSDIDSIEHSGTREPAALDAYLRGKVARKGPAGEMSLREALAEFDRAVALDPGFAQAHAERARTLAWLGNDWTPDAAARNRIFVDARNAADRAIALAPRSGLAFAARSTVLQVSTFDFAAMDVALRRGLELEPGNAELLVGYSEFASQLGRIDALEAAERAIVLDPLEPVSLAAKSQALFFLRRYSEARDLLLEIRKHTQNYTTAAWLGYTEVADGQFDAAIRTCEPLREQWYGQLCLALAYPHAGRKADGRAMLKRMQAEQGDLLAFQYAKIHAFWGEKNDALHWLERAVQTRDSGVVEIRATPFLDTIRESPRYRAIEARLELPRS